MIDNKLKNKSDKNYVIFTKSFLDAIFADLAVLLIIFSSLSIITYLIKPISITFQYIEPLLSIIAPIFILLGIYWEKKRSMLIDSKRNLDLIKQIREAEKKLYSDLEKDITDRFHQEFK